MSDWVLEQKSDKTMPLDSISIPPFLKTEGAADVRAMDSVIAKLQLIGRKVNRYMEKVSIDIVMSRGLDALCTKSTCCQVQKLQRDLKSIALLYNSVFLNTLG